MHTSIHKQVRKSVHMGALICRVTEQDAHCSELFFLVDVYGYIQHARMLSKVVPVCTDT